MKVHSERPMLIHEVKEILEKLKEKGELNYIEERVYNYLNTIPLLDSENAKKLYEELKEFRDSNNIKELTDYHLIKIVEILPKNIDDLKAILYGIVLDKEKAERILEIVKKYA